MADLFHLTMQRLRPGSIIEPGNWGRLLRKYENAILPGQALFGNSWILARELAFELERLRLFAEKPSRFEASFCFQTTELISYRQTQDRPRVQVLHRVSLLNPNALTHVGTISLIDYPPPNSSFLNVTSERAQQYWRGEGDGLKEVVSVSPIEVIECLE